MEQERVKPIIIKDKETGEVKYTLEFNKTTVKASQRAGFKAQDVIDFPAIKIVELFYWALQWHHPRTTMAAAEALFEEIHGMRQKGMVAQLMALYNAPYYDLLEGEEDDEKNAGKYAVEF